MPDPVIRPPHCPHCDAGLPTIELFNWIFGAWIVLECHCPACRKSLAFQILPANLPQPESKAGPRLIS